MQTEADLEPFIRPGVVAFESWRGGLVARLRHGTSTAAVALKGGQVLTFQRNGEPPVLWLSPVARLDVPRPPRGGIPVCWPWFAAHPTDSTKPMHGFARTSAWTVTATEGSPADGAGLSLACDAVRAAPGMWPHQAELSLVVSLRGTGLELKLETRNTSETAFDLTEALHTYFQVSDVSNVLVEGLDGLTYIDKVRDNKRSAQTGRVHIEGEIDRIYLGHHGPVEIVDKKLRRRTRIRKSGSASTVVWNPDAAKAARLGDIEPPGSAQEFRRFVCVETANAADNAVSLAPGQSHAVGLVIDTVPL